MNYEVLDKKTFTNKIDCSQNVAASLHQAQPRTEGATRLRMGN